MEFRQTDDGNWEESLNPYYNGRYSWRVKTHISLKTK